MVHSLTISRVADQALAWLLTYALHSTLLLAAAWGISRRLGGRSLRLQETLWRCALVGGLVTASAQLAFGQLGHAPLAGSWKLAVAVSAEAPRVGLPAADAAGDVGARDALASGAARQPAPEPWRAAAEPRPAASAPASPAAPLAGAMPAQQPLPGAWAMARWLLPAWGAGALLMVLACLRSYLALRRQLRYRPQVVGGGVLGRLAGLVRRSGIARSVRLTCTWRLRVPVALAGRGAEVCVPPRALFELSDPQQDALLAHELAHLVRRDPLWLPVTHLLVAAFFFQPLNWLARRRLRELSELLCDEWAVAQTGQPLSLAGCLAEVASWSMASLAPRRESGKIGHFPVPGMAGRPSQLAHRIRRLLDGTLPAAGAPNRRGVAVLMAAALLAVALAAPGISAASSTAAPPDPASGPRCEGAADSRPAPASSAAPSRMAAALPRATLPGLAAAAPCAARATMTVAMLAAARQDPAGAAPVAVASAAAAPVAPAAPPVEAEAEQAGPPSPPGPPGAGLEAEQERLRAATARLAHLDQMSALSKERIAALAAAAERISRDIDLRVRQQMQDLDRRLAAAHGGALRAGQDLPPVEELAALGTELAGIAAELHPSREEMAQLESELRKLAANPPRFSAEEMRRMHEEMARELAKLPEGGLSKAEIERLRAEVRRAMEEGAAALRHAPPPEERAKIIAEAHRFAEQARPDRAQLDALRDLRRQHEHLSRMLAEQRTEIEAMQREIRIQADALRDQARRLSDSRRASPRPRPEPRPRSAPHARPAVPATPAAPAAPSAPMAAPAAPRAPVGPAAPSAPAAPTAPTSPPPEAEGAPPAPPPSSSYR